MQEWQLRFNEQRAAKLAGNLERLLYPRKIPLELRYRLCDGAVPFAERAQADLAPIRRGEVWGRTWQSAWFHAVGTVPQDWAGSVVVALVNLTGECCLFDAEGTPVYGLTGYSVHRESHCRDRFELLRPARGGERIELWIEASASGLFGVVLARDPDPQDPDRFGVFEARVREASLAVFREDIWHLWLDCTLLLDQMRGLPPRSVRRARILRALCEVADRLSPHDLEPEAVAGARARLAPLLQAPATASSLATRAVGHAHIDTAWLWPLAETVRKCARTFATQLALIQRYPGYVFGASQPQLYQFVKDRYPALYDKIRRAIREGRWEPQGAMWVEADTNLIGGESMVRQILHGKGFYRDEFGVEVRNLWLPDVFGYSASMPQILRKAGIEALVTQKLSWNQFDRFPHHTFRWVGIDGSDVLVHCPPEDTYNSTMLPSGLAKAAEGFVERDFLDEFLTLFGVGDGGGGPTEENIEMALRQRDLEGSPRVSLGPAQEALDRLAARRGELAEWCGELYLELHRGTYTTQARNKRANRMAERRLRDVEILWSCLPIDRYPQGELDRLWKLLLLNQFHDILPGSSIREVYVESLAQYREIEEASARLARQAAEGLFEADPNALVLVNTSGTAFSGPLRLPEDWGRCGLVDEDGEPLAAQREGEAIWVKADVPPLGVRTLRATERGGSSPDAGLQPVRVEGGWTLENEWVRYRFDASGVLVGATDKECGSEVLARPAELQVFEDAPVNWEAWDIDINYEGQLREILRPVACTPFGGPVRQGLLLTYRFGRSTVRQRVVLAAGSRRLDFETEVDWCERRRLLRAAFFTSLREGSARFDIQFGTVERPAHRNTSWDCARFEVPAHRFADLSGPDWGVALLTDCKYGYKVHRGELSVSLLRGSVHPDPEADQGEHRFVYSLLPHRGSLADSRVFAEATVLDRPPLVFPGFAAAGVRRLPVPVRAEGRGVVFETLKRAEWERAWILRIWECRGCPAEARLEPVQGLRCEEVDLMERTLGAVTLEGGEATIRMRPFDIRTFKITPAGGSCGR